MAWRRMAKRRVASALTCSATATCSRRYRARTAASTRSASTIGWDEALACARFAVARSSDQTFVENLCTFWYSIRHPALLSEIAEEGRCIEILWQANEIWSSLGRRAVTLEPMPTQRLTVEERAVISRARSGAKASGSFRGSSGVSSTPAQTHPYPAASAKTLSLREHTELKKNKEASFSFAVSHF